MASKPKPLKMDVVFLEDKHPVTKLPSAPSHWYVVPMGYDSNSRLLLAYANLVAQPELLSRRSDSMEIHEAVERGLPVLALNRLVELLGITREQLAPSLDVSPRTLSRRTTLRPVTSERLLRLANLFQYTLELIEDLDLARRWFFSPRPALGGRTPFDIAATEFGGRQVENLIGRLEHGVYS